MTNLEKLAAMLRSLAYGELQLFAREVNANPDAVAAWAEKQK